MSSLICAWTHSWVNNRDADDIRCHRAHNDVTVMLHIEARRNSRHFAEDISKIFCSMKMFLNWLRFHWSLFPKFTWLWFAGQQTGTRPLSEQVHYLDVTISAIASQTTSSSMFFQPFVQADIKENINVRVIGPLWGESPVTGGFPSQRASNAESVSVAWRFYLSDK